MTGSVESASRWSQQPWRAMSDLAEAVDELICSFDYMDTAMDNLATLIFLTVVVTLALLGLARWLHARFRPPAEAAAEKPTIAAAEPIKSAASEIIKSADSVLATSVNKVTAGAPKKPAKNVPATPPNKKRLSRMSPGPEPARRISQHAAAPTASGPDAAAVQWVNDLFFWLYHDVVIVNELLQHWIDSMNNYSKKSVEEQGVGLEMVRVLDSAPPQLANLYAECDSKDDVTITLDCEATPAFQLKTFRQQGDKVDVSHYRLNVNRFRARLTVVCITERLQCSVRCDGWPEVKVALAPVGPLRLAADETSLQSLVSELASSALRSTQVDLELGHYPTCPRLRRHMDPAERVLPVHYDSMLRPDSRNGGVYTSSASSLGHSTHAYAGGAAQLQGDKRLLVKVVGAKDLGGKSGCQAPYCVVEMDEPPQKNQTAIKRDTTSPVWDEHFLFELSPNTAELLFEIYDRTGPAASPGGTTQHRFLGLGIVGIDELLVSPSQRQVIGLQPRPMEEQDISGVLTVEFLFIEGAGVPDTGNRPFKLKETLRTVSPSGHTMTTTHTTLLQNGRNNAALTETALRELELSPAAANKSTLIIHSVQREPKRSIKVELTGSGKFIEVESENTQGPGDQVDDANVLSTSTPQQSPKTVRIAECKQNGALNINRETNGDPGDYVNNASGEASDTVPEPPRRKRRDFFGTIKRRLGRSRTRGAGGAASDGDANHLRSVSAERGVNGDALSVPNRSAYSAGASPAQSGDESRTSRSEMSGVSGVSGVSARTFIHSASTLVLETLEAGVRKHYLVPLAVAQKNRWRRKGVKLHIFNEHTFRAKHLTGGTVCAVCRKNIARRMGKQGYECRDCLMQCHKQCHVNAPDACPNSSVPSMQLSMLPVLNE